MRLLPWLVLIILVVWALRKNKGIQIHYRTSKSSNKERGENPFSRHRSAESDVEVMLCCAHCQVHFPESEAVKRRDLVFCSQAHADLH